MPEMNGIEATQHILSELPFDYHPVVVGLTADAFKETAEKCIEAGMTEVVTKPINHDKLREILNKYS